MNNNMTKEEQKELLYKDLCARIPYNISVNYKGEIYGVLGITNERLVLCKPFKSQVFEYCPLVEEVKPYLLPMSTSMDLDQRIEYSKTLVVFNESHCSQTHESYDWFNKNNLDYRGLIDMGLAIDATNLNIY
jgi:hypothetical protein